MKLGTVSTDLLIKLALLAGGALLVVYLVRRSGHAVTGAFDAAGAAVGEAWDQVQDVADAVIVGVNPSNPSNWVNQAVTSAGAAVVSPTGPGRNADGSWTLGGWLYDVTHSDPLGQMIYFPSTAPAAVPDYGADPTRAAFGFFPNMRISSAAKVQADLQTIADRGRVVGGL